MLTRSASLARKELGSKHGDATAWKKHIPWIIMKEGATTAPT